MGASAEKIPWGALQSRQQEEGSSTLWRSFVGQSDANIPPTPAKRKQPGYRQFGTKAAWMEALGS